MAALAIKMSHMFLAPSLITDRVHTNAVIAMAMTLSNTAVWVLSCAINMGVAVWTRCGSSGRYRSSSCWCCGGGGCFSGGGGWCCGGGGCFSAFF